MRDSATSVHLQESYRYWLTYSVSNLCVEWNTGSSRSRQLLEAEKRAMELPNHARSRVLIPERRKALIAVCLSTSSPILFLSTPEDPYDHFQMILRLYIVEIIQPGHVHAKPTLTIRAVMRKIRFVEQSMLMNGCSELEVLMPCDKQLM